jgi:hypothetical protein
MVSWLGLQLALNAVSTRKTLLAAGHAAGVYQINVAAWTRTNSGTSGTGIDWFVPTLYFTEPGAGAVSWAEPEVMRLLPLVSASAVPKPSLWYMRDWTSGSVYRTQNTDGYTARIRSSGATAIELDWTAQGTSTIGVAVFDIWASAFKVHS